MNLYIFRRDIRIIDNRGLNTFIKFAKEKDSQNACLFIFNPKQIDHK